MNTNVFPWVWNGFKFESKAGLRRAIRCAFAIGQNSGATKCINAARKECVISADEYAEFVKEYGL